MTVHPGIVPIKSSTSTKPRLGTLDKADSASLPPNVTLRPKGAVLGAVEVVTIYWGAYWRSADGAKLSGQIDGFFDYILQSDYMTLLREYNTQTTSIGLGSRVASFTMDAFEPGSIVSGHREVTEAQVIEQLKLWIADPTFKQITANTLYFIYLPPNVLASAIFTGKRQVSCSDFCGYHDMAGTNMFFALVPFPNCDGCTNGSTFDSITTISSHELAEAVTDPALNAWFDSNSKMEIGDLCTPDAAGSEPSAFGARMGGYLVQSEWSQARGTCILTSLQHADLTSSTAAATASAAALTAYTWGDFKQVAYRSTNGHIHELYVDPSGPWAHADLTDVTSAPPASTGWMVGYEWDKYKQVVYFSADGHIHELYATQADGWNHADLTDVIGAPSAARTVLAAYAWKEYKQVVYCTADGHIHELFCSAKDGWSHADLTDVIGAPPAAGTSLSCYAWDKYKQVVYLTNDGHVHELSASIEDGWSYADLTEMSGAPLASGVSLYGYSWDKFKQVVYQTPNGHIHELYCSLDVPWSRADLTSLTHAPTGDPGTMIGYTWNGSKRIVYYTSNGHIHELVASMARGWDHNDLTELTRSWTASGDTRPVGYSWNGFRQIVYVSTNGHVHELFDN